jgi:hypothetical protein
MKKNMNYLNFLNEKFPIRRKDEEKKSFRDFILEESKGLGFEGRVETTSDGKNENVIVGDPKTAKVVLTAHYDTPATSIFPNLMIPRCQPLFWAYQFLPVIVMLATALSVSYLVGMVWLQDSRAYMLTFLAIYYGLYFIMFRGFSNPKNYNDNTSGVATLLEIMRGLDEDKKTSVAFIFFDNEEKGKKGSKAYFNDHKTDMEKKLLINFDCVGNGETVVFIAKEEAEKTEEYKMLAECFTPNNGYTTEFYPMRGSESNSDYKNFPMGIGCMACKRTKRGVLYTPFIHTPKDTVAKNENIEYIARGTLSFIGSLVEEKYEDKQS